MITDLIEHIGHKYNMEVVTEALPMDGFHKGMVFHDFSHLRTSEEMAGFLKKAIMKQSKIAITINCWATYLYSTDRLRICPPFAPRPAFNPIPCEAESGVLPFGKQVILPLWGLIKPPAKPVVMTRGGIDLLSQKDCC
ncbi:MAG: hypothetical protein A4E52_01994 [Pelotomaculum sp. PtaB.Bin013]|uniref:Uncharacterized protein n=1 Tax=Pelotomaculum isophthalicicum JI TaxID=947010 RepID=A0A9X4H144_9FIRM|nr:hypothetical protein [Pelotomaculum isophthalicicum]MDF9407836.1 hypothetical protein [Pelotomaculum isophthalicicum JI]OPX82870.1 MAG: hypothetical protein A4E52_01994 [Pelotomaculum sp. PtaB.Bin013]